jgi:hypothetical protein
MSGGRQKRPWRIRVTTGGICYKFLMPKIIEQWLLFRYIDGELTPLSKPFKTREQAEKAREKYAERDRKTIGLGVIRLPKQG